MSKISNTLMMLKILETGRVYKISELSDMLECSNRTIRTYKEDLEKAGVYIESVPGRYGGYFYSSMLETSYFNFNKVDLNNLERLYLSLKEKTDLNLIPLENVIDKLRYSLVFNHSLNKTKTKSFDDTYNYISKMINIKKTLSFIYKGKEISFMPHNIYINSNDVYITGINCEINEIRTYNINDIKIIKKN